MIESMIYNALPNLGAGLKMLSDVGTLNVGLIIDALHFHRYGGVPADLAGLGGGPVALLQVCDGTLDPPTRIERSQRPLPRHQSSQAPSIALEGRAFRLLPGEGELPLDELVAQLPTTPISVEAPCFPLQQVLDAGEIARRAYRSTERIIARSMPRRGV